jgi:hypothetical protein
MGRMGLMGPLGPMGPGKGEDGGARWDRKRRLARRGSGGGFDWRLRLFTKQPLGDGMGLL